MCTATVRNTIRGVVLSQNDNFNINTIMADMKKKELENVTTFDVMNILNIMCENGVLIYRNGRYKKAELCY